MNWVNVTIIENKKNRVIFLLLTVILSFNLTACNLLRVSADSLSSTLVLSVLSNPKTFNYVLSQESPNIFGLTYEGLITENPLTGKKEPQQAESWTVSQDKLHLIFTLRQGLKWSDGQPLTVDDVVFTYNDLYLNPNIPFNGRDGLRIGQSRTFPTVRKINDRQVEFITAEPFAPFLDAASFPILPKHILEKAIKTKGTNGKPLFLGTWGVETPPEEIIVNGPYKLKNYQTSERVVFEKNSYYWKKSSQGNQLPYIERVIWSIVESTDTALIQFRSGSLDSIGVSPDYFSLLKREEKRGNFTIYNGGPAFGTTFISFNQNKGSRKGNPLVDPIKSTWFNTLEFRQAVAYGIDRERIVNNIFRGLGELQDSDISKQSPFYDKSLQGYEYNPKKAKELLLGKGFKYNEKKELFDAKGNRVEFTLITNAGNKIREAMGAQIQEDLQKIGIKVDFNPVAFSVLVDRLSNSLDWECFLLGFTGGNEPNDGANVWFTQGSLHSFNQYPQPGTQRIEGQEFADWENKIAQLYIEGARELDFEKRRLIYNKAQQIISENVSFIYLVNPFAMSAIRNSIEGIEYSALGGGFWNIEQLKVKR